MLSASEKYAKEATAVWHGSHFAIFMFGLNQRRQEAIGILTETFGGAGAARAPGPTASMSAARSPIPSAAWPTSRPPRQPSPCATCSAARARIQAGRGAGAGGNSIEFALVQHDSPEGGINYVVSGKGTEFSMSEGLGGGYAGAHPAPTAGCTTTRPAAPGRNINPFPTSLDEMTGEAETISWGVFPLKGEDALYVRSDGGGGFGDPLEREPERVRADIEAGMVSARAWPPAVYGVSHGQRRGGRGGDAGTPRGAAPSPACNADGGRMSGTRISATLVVNDERAIACMACGHSPRPGRGVLGRRLPGSTKQPMQGAGGTRPTAMPSGSCCGASSAPAAAPCSTPKSALGRRSLPHRHRADLGVAPGARHRHPAGDRRPVS